MPMEPWEWAEIVVGQAEESLLRARFLPLAERATGQYRRGILTSLEYVQKLYEELLAETTKMQNGDLPD